MSALKSVIITLPSKGLSKPTSHITCEPSKVNSKLNFASILGDRIRMDCSKMPKHLEAFDTNETVLLKQDLCMRGKKRRLDHLTWEEKLQRKKLKNRVAAQTSRDRKKAKLDELEDAVKILKDRNDMLVQECSMLKARNETLLKENERLKLNEESNKPEEKVCNTCQGRVSCAIPTLGSAVSPLNPLQQGGTAQMAHPLMLKTGTSKLLKILTLYLLSMTYSANSKETTISRDSKNLPKAFCERLPLKWKQMLLNRKNRLQLKKKPPKNMTIKKEWWGRHQIMWKPIASTKA